MPTTASDVAALRTRNAAVVALAKRNLSRFWATLDLTKPEASRDALLQYMPILVATYGQAAATAAADWYETVRAKDVRGTYTATLAEGATAEQVTGAVRYQAGHLFTDNPGAMLATLGGSVQKYVVNAGRETVRGNAYRDKARPRYARVPSGGKTCAFCLLLASRGFVYVSEEAAGEYDAYHDDCSCEAVADFSDDPSIDGYEPDSLYDLYQSARSASGRTDIKGIAAEMRRQNPDLYTDGVVSAD